MINLLKPLRAEGLFVTVMPKEDDLIIECRIYITDRDSDANTTNILILSPEGYLQDENQVCLACKTSPGEVRTKVNGSISCPLSCGSYTRPYALIEKIYRAKLNNLSVLPSYMASTISAALTTK